MDCGKSTKESNDKNRQSDSRRKERVDQPVKLYMWGDEIVPLSKRKKSKVK